MDISKPLYFATSGIRGKANTEISPELAFRIGKNIVGWISRKNPEVKNFLVCIGYDNRRNSKLLAYCAAAAITSLGVNVKISSFSIPTPFLIFSTIHNNAHAGLMITGSHLPETDNGMILFNGIGNYFKGSLDEEIKENVSWENLGKLQYFDDEERSYLAFISYYTSKVMVKPSNLRILVDPAHGVMRKYLHVSLNSLVKEFIRFNWEEDDTFPGRISEPSPANLVKTRDEVLKQNCDLGIATDMDGDRVMFITKSGEIISGDYIGALFASFVWKKDPASIVVAPINSSGIIAHVAELYGGTLKYCKVGPPSIIEAIQEWDAKFAFEESGKYIFVETAIWPDSVLSVLKLLSIMQQTQKSLDEIISEFPKFYSVKTKLPYSRKNRHIFDAKIIELTEQNLSETFEINDLDGYRINFSDNSWLLLRLSGTEDFIRIFSEHTDQIKAEKLNDLGKKIVHQLKELDN
ncbi:MAG: hypothetical protein GPJ54_00025 [Candidatus Heimdallarchaeota archaeon]|nr:hypothetical protein [Candidatus Heimdallarchaeota archaeon]